MTEAADDSKELETWYNNLVKLASSGGGMPPVGGAPRADDGDNGPMDYRVANLEAFAADAKERLARVETKIDHIGQEVSNFKWWMAGAILTILVTVAGTAIGIQQMTVTTFQAAGEARASGTAQPIVIQIPAAPPAPQAAPAPAK